MPAGAPPDHDRAVRRKKSRRGLVGSLYPTTAGNRPRACGRSERQKARTQIGTEHNATALPPSDAAEIRSKIKPAQRTRVPPHLVALYRRSLLSAARTCCCSDEWGCGTSCRTCRSPIIGCPLPSCLACRRSLLTGPTAAAQPFAGTRLHARLRAFTVVAVEARSSTERRLNLLRQ